MRQEPIVSVTGLVSMFSSKKTHDEQVNEALNLFTEAEKKMVSVIENIDADITAERKAIVEAGIRIAQAVGSKSRLERTLERMKALTA